FCSLLERIISLSRADFNNSSANNSRPCLFALIKLSSEPSPYSEIPKIPCFFKVSSSNESIIFCSSSFVIIYKSIFHHIKFYFQIIDDKFLSVGSIFTHIEFQQF